MTNQTVKHLNYDKIKEEYDAEIAQEYKHTFRSVVDYIRELHMLYKESGILLIVDFH